MVLTAFGSGVVDGDEEEAGGGGGRAGTGAVAGGEQGGDGGGGEAMRATEDEGSDQVAHHVVKEAVGGDAVDEEVAGDVPLGVVDGADGFRGSTPTHRVRQRRDGWAPGAQGTGTRQQGTVSADGLGAGRLEEGDGGVSV